MSYVANDVATIPAQGFDWYVIFFEGMFTNALQKEVDDNFMILGQKVGRDVLVVKGFEPDKFNASAYEAFEGKRADWLKKLRPPALFVSDTPPKAMEDVDRFAKAKVMIFPLEEIYKKQQSITGFLAELLKALRDKEAYQALEDVDPTKLQRKWGWLTDYFSMNPGFFGFGVKLDLVISQLIFKQDSQKSFG